MPINYVENERGPTLGYSSKSGVRILNVDGKAFKDLNKDGKLVKYEDWRLSAEERAKDLASKMSVAQIAGLMLYSRHQSIPAGQGPFPGTYGGNPFFESVANPSDLSDQQKEFLTNDDLRHVLITTVESPEVAAQWNNNSQELVEGIGLGIPINTSSDPRHASVASTEYNAGAGGKISMWPETLGLAATFDPEVTEDFGKIASKEYRALGITTALSPQIDIATDPRWSRFNGTFGEDPSLSADLAKAYVDGFQTTDDTIDGWGEESVNAMVKHWPGGGSGEAGRDAHWGYGKFAVYPGNNFADHLLPFTEGAFKLSGKTGKASAVMPYYTISVDQDDMNSENVGNSYNKYLISDLLRDRYGYGGVVCTDWLITGDEPAAVDIFAGKPWGVEHLTVAERHYKALIAGVDQFGGNNEAAPIIEAYEMGVKEHGEEFMRKRFETSAVRLLLNIFRLGLFENPYLDVEKSADTVGSQEFMAKGYDAQLKSIVMVKNKNQLLPLVKRKTVYIPKRYLAAGKNWFGMEIPEKYEYSFNLDVVRKYFNVTDKPDEADFALVGISSPEGEGFSREDVENGGTGYVPISLQYGTYTAEFAREKSIAGDVRDVLDRTYKGKSFTPRNTTDLELVQKTKEEMKGKPVIVSLLLSKPTIVEEFECNIDALLLNFGVQDQALLDILTGVTEPSGLLPMQLPAHMKTVEEQYEDVPHDMVCHLDTEGNEYDFAFGLNWSGVIQDDRTKKYKKNHKIRN
ncbi:glycoside hydrolase family 3 protein [Metabacillus halosaccharovorans]|uniref:glycoside hydrolase family 3 protein n=1 Tax=Metabacillus halosaccharovorans TaxID=930124 RepID=UPI00099526E2|nr:glycoside hydrolase family 3 N-terminal domain-containing protein [Metabacillus halosaccharovorans]